MGRKMKAHRFIYRYPDEIDRCPTEEPTLDELQEGHSSRCWLASVLHEG